MLNLKNGVRNKQFDGWSKMSNVLTAVQARASIPMGCSPDTEMVGRCHLVPHLPKYTRIVLRMA